MRNHCKERRVRRGKGEGEILQEFSPGYSCYRNHLRSISVTPLYKEICSPLIAGEVKWFTSKCRHSASAQPRWDGSSSAGTVGTTGACSGARGSLAWQGRRRGEWCAPCICKQQQQRSEGCWSEWSVVEDLWWRGSMRRSQETVTEIRTLVTEGVRIEKVYVSSGRNGAVKKVRKEIEIVGEVSGIEDGNLEALLSRISGKCLAWCL